MEFFPKSLHPTIQYRIWVIVGGADIRWASHLREGGELGAAGVRGQPGRQHTQVHRLGAQRTGTGEQHCTEDLIYLYFLKTNHFSFRLKWKK